MSTPQTRFYIHDSAKTQDTGLATFNHLRPRFLIIDRTTGLAVDEASSRYEARQALAMVKAEAR